MNIGGFTVDKNEFNSFAAWLLTYFHTNVREAMARVAVQPVSAALSQSQLLLFTYICFKLNYLPMQNREVFSFPDTNHITKCCNTAQQQFLEVDVLTLILGLLMSYIYGRDFLLGIFLL
jgi:hypothetical protein